jgi:hypothetical protein
VIIGVEVVGVIARGGGGAAGAAGAAAMVGWLSAEFGIIRVKKERRRTEK